jgi:predicted XRE-type DNA-binding protein
MKQSKSLVATNVKELTQILDLPPTAGAEIELRSQLNDKVIAIVQETGLTHEQVAKLARTSRSRVTAILNRNTQDVSTDLLLRIITSLGYRAKITFSRAT